MLHDIHGHAFVWRPAGGGGKRLSSPVEVKQYVLNLGEECANWGFSYSTHFLLPQPYELSTHLCGFLGIGLDDDIVGGRNDEVALV